MIEIFKCLLGGAAHYFFLSSFCFLSMINVDLWWKFRKLTLYSATGAKKFRFYLVFSLGVPGLIVATGVLLKYYYK